MKIQLNGDDREVTAATLPALLDELVIAPQTLLIEHNGEALRRDEWPARPLQPGDRLEFIRIVAGG